MNEVLFVQQREPDWQRLTYLSEKADVSPTLLTPDELHEFIRLYRKCSSDLAKVRTKSNNVQLIDFLNDLVARAYSSLYRTRRKPILQAIQEAIVLSARTVRKVRWFVVASVLTFFGGILFSFFGVQYNADLKDALEPKELRPVFGQWKSPIEHERDAQESILATGLYDANNPRVAIMEGSVAASTFGIGSAMFLWENGVILGTLAYEVSTVGRLPHLLIWIAPHGVTEISGLILAGAAGFRMGWALIVPGRRKRGAALREAGKDAIVVLSTAVVLMFIAAPVEGFFSFNPKIPDALKIIFAVLAAAAWTVFWVGYGREPHPLAATSS